MMSSNSWCNPTLLAMMEGGEVEEDCALKYMNENSDTLRLQIKSLAENGFESMAVSLMKWCLRTEQFKTDVAMISNFLYMLHKLGRSEDFHRQCCQLLCCTAKHVVRTMQESKYQSAILHLASEIFLLQDLLNPRQYCCTEELLLSWLSVQKDENQGNDVILENVNKMVGVVENVQHLTIFLRALYNKFGTLFLPLCTDLALRVLKLQCHLSGSDEFMGSKESVSLAQAVEVVGLLYRNFTPLYTECLLSCLHLDPSKERYRMVEEFFIGKLNDSVGSNCKTLPVGIETYNSVLQSINALRPVVLDRKLSWAVLKKLIIDNFAKCGYIFDPVSNSFVCVKPENTGMDLTNGCGIKTESDENVGTAIAQTTRADSGVVKDSSLISTKKRNCTRIRSCNLRINHDEKNGSYTVQKINTGRRKSVSKMENCPTEDVEKYDGLISDIKDESRLNNNKKAACRKLSKQLGAQYIDDDEANNLGIKTRPRGSEKDEKMSKSVTASMKGSTPRKRSIRGKEDATSSGSKKCKAAEIPRITRRSSIALEGMASKSEKSDDGEMCRFCRRLVRTRNQRLWHEKAMCQKRGKKSPEKWNHRSAWKGKSIGRGTSMKWSPEKRLVRFARCIKSRMALSRLRFPNGLQLTNCFVKLARIAVDPSPIVAEDVEVAGVKPTLAGAVLDEFCDTNELSDTNELRDTKLVIDDMDSMLDDSSHNNFVNKDAKIEVKEDSEDVQSFAPCVCDGCGEVVPDCSWLTAHIVTCIGRPGSGNNDSEMDEFASEGPSWVESVRTNGIENETTGQLPGHELFTNLTIDSSNANASFDHNPNQADVGPAQMLQMLQKGVENPVVFDQSVAAKNAENNAVQTINSSTYSVSSQISVPECAVERSGKEIMFNDVSMYEFVEFQCSGCLLTFFNDTSLGKHIQSSDHRCATITKLSVFCCVKCGIHYLDKHIMWHHAVYLCRSRPILEAPNELYKCLFCTKAFLSELFLQRHVWLKHNNETVTVNHLQKAGHPSVQEFGNNPEAPAAGWNSFQKKEIKACDATSENGHKTKEHSGGCNQMDSSKSNDPQALLDLACSIVLGGGCSTSEPLESADANKPSPQKQLPSPTTPAAAGPTRRTAKGIMYKNVFMQCIVNYLCSSCKKDLSTKASKKEHKQSACFNSDSKRFTYLRQYSYLCPYCSEKFPSQKACRQHQLTVCLVLMGVKTDELNYKQLLCPFCDKKYFNIITLKGHMTLIHKVNKFESSQLLDGTGTFTEMLGQGSDGANSSRNDDTDSIAEPIETKLPDVIDEAKKLKKKRKPKKKAAIVAIEANSVAEKPVLENSLSDESISLSGINKIEPVSDVPISTSAAIATENMDCVEVSTDCKEFKNRIIMDAENSALLVKFESSSTSEYRMECIKTEDMSDSSDPKILCVPDLEPKVGKLEPTSDEEKPVCGNVEPTCCNVEPTCGNVEPACGNVEPTCGNVEPTCDKVEPICSKVEPICDNVEPICGNVEPSCGHLDPLCIDSKPALDSSEQILHHPEPTCDNAIAFDDIKLSSQKSTFECLSETVELTSEVMEALLGGPEVEEQTESDEKKLVIRKRPKKVRKKVNAKTKKKSQY